MSALAQKEYGYVTAAKLTGQPSAIEYQLFTKITGQLSRNSGPDMPFSKLAEALDENLTLWRTLALEVAHDSNELPDQLRAQLFYLYEFTRAHTKKVLRREADVKVLIEINTAVMKGLRQSLQNGGTS